MSSETELANYALGLLGQDALTSIDDDSARARLVKRMFGMTRDKVLRSFTWNCAIHRQALTVLADAPVSGWDYQFTLPTDPYCLRALTANEDMDDGDTGDVFKVEGRKLLSNESSIVLRYIKRITDYGDYDAELYVAMGCAIAVALAMPVTGQPSKLNAMIVLARESMSDARMANGGEGTPHTPSVTSLTSAVR